MEDLLKFIQFIESQGFEENRLGDKVYHSDRIYHTKKITCQSGSGHAFVVAEGYQNLNVNCVDFYTVGAICDLGTLEDSVNSMTIGKSERNFELAKINFTRIVDGLATEIENNLNKLFPI